MSWEQHPLAVPLVEQWECSMGTCDCLWHDGVYHMFYTDCGSRCEYKDKPQRGSWIFCATSTDGIHFQKDLKPLVPGGDCTVFRDPATGLFHLIRGGGNRLVSKDLRNWEEIPGDFVQRKPGTTGECPHEFEWNGWYYFILGTNAIWKSRSALGPWEELTPTIYDGLFVPKVAEFTGNRRILAGFLFERGWAGHLALRELSQEPDGSLGIKFPPELIPAGGPPQKLAFAALSAAASGDGTRIRINTPGRFAAGMLTEVPRNSRITLRVVPSPAQEPSACACGDKASTKAAANCASSRPGNGSSTACPSSAAPRKTRRAHRHGPRLRHRECRPARPAVPTGHDRQGRHHRHVHRSAADDDHAPRSRT